jgi:hypothetical protein
MLQTAKRRRAMRDVSPSTTSDVSVRSATTMQTFADKWGADVMRHGFCVVPSLLLDAQARLGIDAEQLAVLVHLAHHWCQPEGTPYPSRRRLAETFGVTDRTYRLWISDLERKGLVQRVERRDPHHRRLTNFYDLSGLVARLKELEPTFTAPERTRATSATSRDDIPATDVGVVAVASGLG